MSVSPFRPTLYFASGAAIQEVPPGPKRRSSQLFYKPTPRTLFDQVTENVIGQDRACRTMAVGVYNHYKRISLGKLNPSEEMVRNLLLKHYRFAESANAEKREKFVQRLTRNIARYSLDQTDLLKESISLTLLGGLKDEAIQRNTRPMMISGSISESTTRSDAAAIMNDLSSAAEEEEKATEALALPNQSDDVTLQKQNILIVGPTGVGKTEIARNLAQILGVPFAKFDVTTITEAGYIGQKIEDPIKVLLDAADSDIKMAEKGILYLDEIDKKAASSSGSVTSDGTKDVSGRGVQQALLQVLEDTSIKIAKPKTGFTQATEEMKVDTGNILFIAGGAFVGLVDIIRKRLALGKKEIGFNAKLAESPSSKDLEVQLAEEDALLEQVTPDDLKEFGMIPELLGRFPIIVTLRNMTKALLVRILQEPKNSFLKQQQKSFGIDQIDLQFTPEALEAIAEYALKLRTGARALSSVLAKVTEELQFEAPEIPPGTITLDAEFVHQAMKQAGQKLSKTA